MQEMYSCCLGSIPSQMVKKVNKWMVNFDVQVNLKIDYKVIDY